MKNMERKFEIGDVVCLMSDNATNTPMTVNCYRYDECFDELGRLYMSDTSKKEVKCVWRDKNDNPHEEYYHEDSLIRVEIQATTIFL